MKYIFFFISNFKFIHMKCEKSVLPWRSVQKWDITCVLIMRKGVCACKLGLSCKIQLCIGQVICRLIYQFN